LLLEAVVNVEYILLVGTLAFTLGLLLALEVIGIVGLGELFGSSPLLVLFSALIGLTSFFPQLGRKVR